MDIPLSYGPWKFTGLPGLIMEVKTQDEDYHWIATGVEKPKRSHNLSGRSERL